MIILRLCEWISIASTASAWLSCPWPRITTIKRDPLCRLPILQVRPYVFLGDSDSEQPSNQRRIRSYSMAPREELKGGRVQPINGTIDGTNTRNLDHPIEREQMLRDESSSPSGEAESIRPQPSSSCSASAKSRNQHKNHRTTSNKRTSRSSKIQSGRSTTLTDNNQALMDEGLIVKPIGVVRSIYRLCVGTPRQGLLAPNARGCIDLFTLGNSSPVSSVEGLESYSHIWVVFIFHLNTQSENASRRIKSKITPPALGGQKVGIFATRAPHRFNPIGMTLCKLDRIERIDKRNVKLHISGMDLVDGTPVLDIKPYVPVYDSVTPMGKVVSEDVRVPDWVEGGLLLKRSIIVTNAAREELEGILQKDTSALEFYGPDHGEATVEETIEATLECIRQVLRMDVRSSYQTKKSRAGKFKAERSTRLKVDDASEISDEEGEADDQKAAHCTQQVDNLLIHFNVEEHSPRGSTSENSGAEDTLCVTAIKLLEK